MAEGGREYSFIYVGNFVVGLILAGVGFTLFGSVSPEDVLVNKDNIEVTKPFCIGLLSINSNNSRLLSVHSRFSP